MVSWGKCNTCDVILGLGYDEVHKTNARHIQLTQLQNMRASQVQVHIKAPRDLRVPPGGNIVLPDLQGDDDTGDEDWACGPHDEDGVGESAAAAATLGTQDTDLAQVYDWLSRDHSLDFGKHEWIGEVVLSPVPFSKGPALFVGTEELKRRALNADVYHRVRIVDVRRSEGDVNEVRIDFECCSSCYEYIRNVAPYATNGCAFLR
jgi:hypothetical protein